MKPDIRSTSPDEQLKILRPITNAVSTNASDDERPHVREIVNGSLTPSIDIVPLAALPGDPGKRGTVVLVPLLVHSPPYYFPLVYISGDEGTLTVHLPASQNIAVVDLPHGMFTPPAELNQMIAEELGGGPPSSVGPT